MSAEPETKAPVTAPDADVDNMDAARKGDTMFSSLNDWIEFSEKRRIKKSVVVSPHMKCDLLCYEPGQGTPAHHHVGEDEVFYVVEGKGWVTVDDHTREVSAGHVIFSPDGSVHSMGADDDSRLVIFYTRSPGRPQKKA